MRFFLLLTLALFAAPAFAGTLMISSDPERHGKLSSLPEIVISELQKAAGIRPDGQPAPADGILSLRVHKMDCTSHGDGGDENASCSFEFTDDKGKSRKVRYDNASVLMDAFRELNDATESVEILECDNNDDCRARVASILCMANENLKSGAPGRSNCSFTD
jgi:hypothetical protein